MKVLVETSARHVHLTENDFEILFGKDAKLTVKKELSQPGEFASNQKVAIIGPKKSIESVTIIGPFRNKSQVELSLTDARGLGIKAPVRLSGDVKNSGSCKIVGPTGEIKLTEGVIIAKRHIHMTNEDANILGISQNEDVMVKLTTNDRALIFDDVSVRINDNFKLIMHIDTDESNAACCNKETYGEIIKKYHEKSK